MVVQVGVRKMKFRVNQSLKLLVSLSILCLVCIGQAHAQGTSGVRNGLPPVRLDSFVHEAGAHAEHIYGDEGADGLPPYEGFGKPHRINTGILDVRDAGLTTGHGSLMPDAWGRDEFLGQEWTQSGARGRTADQGFVDGTPNVNSGAPNGSNNGPNNLPPPPGEGYQPAYTCEGFVGWYSPEEVAMSQYDFPAAFEHFVYSGRYTGSMTNAIMILELQMGRPQGGH